MADKTKETFEREFGSTDMPIPQFVTGPAAHVHLIDLEVTLPQLFAGALQVTAGGASQPL